MAAAEVLVYIARIQAQQVVADRAVAVQPQVEVLMVRVLLEQKTQVVVVVLIHGLLMAQDTTLAQVVQVESLFPCQLHPIQTQPQDHQ
jgi:hypothetical protein